MTDLLSPTTQWVVVVGTIIEVLAWCVMAFAIRYYAPYKRRKDE